MTHDILEKGKSFPIGTIHNGFKKIAEGKWRKVSEHGKTKEEHEEKAKLNKWAKHYTGKTKEEHEEAASKLDTKEYSDVDVVGSKKLEDMSDEERKEYLKTSSKELLGRMQSHLDKKKEGEENKEVKSEVNLSGGYKSEGFKKLDSLTWDSLIDKYPDKEKELEDYTIGQDKIFSKYLKDPVGDYVQTGGGRTFSHNVFDEVSKNPEKFNKMIKELENYHSKNIGKISNQVKKSLTSLEIDFLAGRIDQGTIEKARQDELEKGGNKTEFSTKEREESEEKSIAPEMKKALNILELGHILGRVDEDTIEKARKHEVGHVSVHKDGTKWRKTANGWESVKEESGTKEVKTSNSIKESIAGASIGYRASGGGYGDWEKIGRNSWKNSKTGNLSNDEGIFSRIGGFGDFKIDSNKKSALDQPDMSDKTKEKVFGKEYKKGDKIEYNGVTIHVGKDTSGGQDTTTYTAPSVSEKTFWDLNKLKGFIDSKGKKDKEEKFPTKEDIISKLVSVGNNSDDAKKMVEEHYDYIKRVYPSSGLKKLAEVIRAIY